MFKWLVNKRILVFALLAVMLFSYIAEPTVSKYVYTYTGRAMASLISGNIFTDSFVVSNDNFMVNGREVDSITSESLHGVGMEVVDGVLTVPSDAPTSNFDLDSTSSLTFVVQNNSDYDLVACFNIFLCMGLIRDAELTCTIVALSSSETATDKTSLITTASLNNNGQNSDITLKHHKEPDGSGGSDDPVVDVQLQGLLGVNYTAYSMSVDPSEFLIDRNGDGQLDADNELTEQEFNSFILIRSGETKTFEFSIQADQNIIGQWFSKNCYASITMTAKKYHNSTL